MCVIFSFIHRKIGTQKSVGDVEAEAKPKYLFDEFYTPPLSPPPGSSAPRLCDRSNEVVERGTSLLRAARTSIAPLLYSLQDIDTLTSFDESADLLDGEGSRIKNLIENAIKELTLNTEKLNYSTPDEVTIAAVPKIPSNATSSSNQSVIKKTKLTSPPFLPESQSPQKKREPPRSMNEPCLSGLEKVNPRNMDQMCRQLDEACEEAQNMLSSLSSFEVKSPRKQQHTCRARLRRNEVGEDVSTPTTSAERRPEVVIREVCGGRPVHVEKFRGEPTNGRVLDWGRRKNMTRSREVHTDIVGHQANTRGYVARKTVINSPSSEEVKIKKFVIQNTPTLVIPREFCIQKGYHIDFPPGKRIHTNKNVAVKEVFYSECAQQCSGPCNCHIQRDTVQMSESAPYLFDINHAQSVSISHQKKNLGVYCFSDGQDSLTNKYVNPLGANVASCKSGESNVGQRQKSGKSTKQRQNKNIENTDDCGGKIYKVFQNHPHNKTGKNNHYKELLQIESDTPSEEDVSVHCSNVFESSNTHRSDFNAGELEHDLCNCNSDIDVDNSEKSDVQVLYSKLETLEERSNEHTVRVTEILKYLGSDMDQSSTPDLQQGQCKGVIASERDSSETFGKKWGRAGALKHVRVQGDKNSAESDTRNQKSFSSDYHGNKGKLDTMKNSPTRKGVRKVSPYKEDHRSKVSAKKQENRKYSPERNGIKKHSPVRQDESKISPRNQGYSGKVLMAREGQRKNSPVRQEQRKISPLRLDQGRLPPGRKELNNTSPDRQSDRQIVSDRLKHKKLSPDRQRRVISVERQEHKRSSPDRVMPSIKHAQRKTSPEKQQRQLSPQHQEGKSSPQRQGRKISPQRQGCNTCFQGCQEPRIMPSDTAKDEIRKTCPQKQQRQLSPQQQEGKSSPRRQERKISPQRQGHTTAFQGSQEPKNMSSETAKDELKYKKIVSMPFKSRTLSKRRLSSRSKSKSRNQKERLRKYISAKRVIPILKSKRYSNGKTMPRVVATKCIHHSCRGFLGRKTGTKHGGTPKGSVSNSGMCDCPEAFAPPADETGPHYLRRIKCRPVCRPPVHPTRTGSEVVSCRPYCILPETHSEQPNKNSALHGKKVVKKSKQGTSKRASPSRKKQQKKKKSIVGGSKENETAETQLNQADSLSDTYRHIVVMCRSPSLTARTNSCNDNDSGSVEEVSTAISGDDFEETYTKPRQVAKCECSISQDIVKPTVKKASACIQCNLTRNSFKGGDNKDHVEKTNISVQCTLSQDMPKMPNKRILINKTDIGIQCSCPLAPKDDISNESSEVFRRMPTPSSASVSNDEDDCGCHLPSVEFQHPSHDQTSFVVPKSCIVKTLQRNLVGGLTTSKHIPSSSSVPIPAPRRSRIEANAQIASNPSNSFVTSFPANQQITQSSMTDSSHISVCAQQLASALAELNHKKRLLDERIERLKLDEEREIKAEMQMVFDSVSCDCVDCGQPQSRPSRKNVKTDRDIVQEQHEEDVRSIDACLCVEEPESDGIRAADSESLVNTQDSRKVCSRLLNKKVRATHQQNRSGAQKKHASLKIPRRNTDNKVDFKEEIETRESDLEQSLCPCAQEPTGTLLEKLPLQQSTNPNVCSREDCACRHLSSDEASSEVRAISSVDTYVSLSEGEVLSVGEIRSKKNQPCHCQFFQAEGRSFGEVTDPGNGFEWSSEKAGRSIGEIFSEVVSSSQSNKGTSESSSDLGDIEIDLRVERR